MFSRSGLSPDFVWQDPAAAAARSLDGFASQAATWAKQCLAFRSSKTWSPTRQCPSQFVIICRTKKGHTRGLALAGWQTAAAVSSTKLKILFPPDLFGVDAGFRVGN